MAFPQTPEQDTDLDTTIPEPSDDGGDGSILTRKYGPLPVWAWGVVVGGTLLAFIFLRGGKRPGPSDTGSQEFPVGGGGAGSGGGSGGGGSDDGGMDLEGLQDIANSQADILELLNQPDVPDPKLAEILDLLNNPPDTNPPPTQSNSRLQNLIQRLKTTNQGIGSTRQQLESLRQAAGPKRDAGERAAILAKRDELVALRRKRRRISRKIVKVGT